MITIPFSGFDVRLHQIENPARLLDELIARESGAPQANLEDHIPYWAELWSSAVALSRELVNQPEWVNGRVVTEIGCGMGLPGIVAGRLGAAAVALTDLLPEALALARANWELNLPNRPVRVERLDWRQPRVELAADVVLASDIAYEERFFEHLPTAFHRLIRPGGMLLLSEPGRAMAESFLDSLSGHDFRVSSFVSSGTWEERPYEVHILKLERPGSFPDGAL